MTTPAPAGPSTRRLALLLAGLSMFGPFSIDTIFPAFPQMAAQFGADKVAMQQTIAVYLAAYALMSIVHGPLSDAIGRRRVILAGLAVFTLASVGCALAPDLGTLLAFRALQGLSAGVGLIVGRAVIRDVLQGHDAQRLMSQVSMIFGIAPAIAPVIGGWMLGAGRWPLIFWFLAVFGVLLLASVGRWLPETHPPELRLPLRPRRLVRDYLAIGANPRFQRLAAAGALNFAGLFLYIASAPDFVMELLRLGERDFAWLFLPTIGGMTLGAFVSGRIAGRWPPMRQVEAGFVCSALAALANVAYNALAPAIAVPWAVLPMSLAAFGVALVFPVLTLSILDMYPRQRGSASSLQAFFQLVLNAAVAGLLSPWLSHHGLHLALGMAVFVAGGWLFWRWEARVARRFPPPPSSPMIEPGEQL
ncbi:multidrug effflux MFS transporter [Pseudoxanthomonas sp.]|uniref:multidrug effflux MFS transporter n=1 Tax=Pseudoxanthomonas sp. TaxID=1871049 RepID=UPI00258E754E|nr:multidrug effflux MFS transporter [Pseudoxanthomonas sp.]MCR6687411.1 multidrug effflux MFS transporter [Pseudoxanthomonas sp.]